MDIGDIMKMQSMKAVSKSNADSYPGDLIPQQPQPSVDGMAPKEGPGFDGMVGGNIKLDAGGGFKLPGNGVDEVYRAFFAGSDTFDMGLFDNLGPGKLAACGLSELAPQRDSNFKVPDISKELNVAEGLGVIGRQQGG